ncbi:hypothetical protein UFOVP1244_61 [uncultured Caudovirales phage]|uniref:Uncharacterized protein n=1 Tax=uncultured Caudovirales phage TaxID=2100421 RepID=A0A6J5RDY3_9CAUD|nr:hypothetical protein UFOVP1244_61 [uncultured Caudovirales phage]
MAKIEEILPEFWKNQEWTIDEDDYSTLNWMKGSTLPKPSESEIRNHSDEVDSLIADRAQRRRQQISLDDSGDWILKVFETYIDTFIEFRRVINDIRNTAVSQAHTGSYTSWDNDVISRMAAIKNKITNARNIP